jgi:hypothetical protein
MGRPLNKRYFGTPAGTELGITLSAFIPTGSSAVNSIILSQKGSRKYIVSNVQGEGKVVLADNAVPLVGEAYLVGYSGLTAISIKKLTSKLAVGFDNVKYSWVLENV